MGRKNLGQLHTAGALDFAVEFDERQAEVSRQRLAKRGFTGAAQADQCNPLRRACLSRPGAGIDQPPGFGQFSR